MPFKPIPVSWNRRAAVCLLGMVALVARLLFSRRAAKSSFLLLEPYGMGDVISLLPMLKALAETGSPCRVLIKDTWRDLVPNDPGVRVVPTELPWTSYSGENKYRFRALTRGPASELLAKLRREVPGSIGIDPRGDIRSIIFLYLAGCSRVVSLDHYLGTNAKIPSWAATTVPQDPQDRRWECAARLLPAAGVFSKLIVSPPAIGCPSEFPRPIRRVGCLPVAPWAGRLWPNERWQELVRQLGASGLAVSGLCGPGQALQAKPALGDVPLAECGSVASWIEAFRHLDLLITLDSGPMHLADAMGLPLVALFGPGQLPMWAPSGPHSRIVHHQDDAAFFPCHQVDGNEAWGKKSMDRISVKEVVVAVEDAINAVG